MAKFNPAVPDTQDPNYLGYSKVVDAPPPDTSTAIALKTAGEAITGSVQLADDWVKKDIDKEIYNNTDAERDQYTSALLSVKNQVKNNTIPGATQPSLAPSDGNTGTPPDPVTNALDQANTLAAARAGGKINDTYYTQRLTTIAQNIRNEYPGYRDYIDQKISAVTGMNPANAYYKNLMQDINTALVSKKTESDKITDQLRTETGIPGQAEFFRARQAGLPQADDYHTMKFINDWNAKKSMFDQWQNSRTYQQANKADDLEKTTQQFTAETGATLYNRFNVVTTLTGLNNPATISSIVSDAQQGKIKLEAPQWDGLLMAVQSAEDAAKSDVFNMSNQRGYATRIGVKDRDTIMNSQLQPYEMLKEAIKSKDVGTMFSTTRNLELTQDTAGLKLLNAPGKLGAYARNNAASMKIFGPNWTNISNQWGMQNGLAGEYAEFVQGEVNNATMSADLRQPGAYQNLYSTMQHVSSANVNPNTKVNDKILDGMSMIFNNQNAPDEAKINAAHYTFNPENDSLLDLFKKDYYDPQKKQTTPGKYSVWGKLFSPENTESMSNLSKKDPSVWTEYKNSADTQFKKLFQQEILDFGNANSNSDPYNNYSPQHGVTHVAYNSDRHEFGLVDDNMRPIPLDYSNSGTTGVSLNRINRGLYNMSKIMEKDGGDVNVNLMNYIKEMGGKLDNIQGLPKQIQAAIELSQQAQFRPRGR